MRLLNCQLQNVRLHGDLDLTFSPRLTLIGGPNESGKSTLVEALHRALFLKAAASGAPVQALQSRLHLGQPVVQLAFEAKGDRWTLRKRFSGSSGQVSLQAESAGKQLTGPVAEDVLAELVGVPETVGSRQATSVLPSRWAHLWVTQGSSGQNLLEAGRSHYDFDQLRQQLERSGGAAVQQSANDQRVEQCIAAALAENFTSRGIKKHSPLDQRQQERAAADARMAQALADLEAYDRASAELAELCDQLEQLQALERPALVLQQNQWAQATEEASRLDGAIQLADKTLEPLRLRHAAASSTLQQLEQLNAEHEQRQQRLAALTASADGAQQRETELLNTEQRCQANWTALNQQRQTLEQRQTLLQRLVEHTSTSENLQRQEAELRKQRQTISQQQALAAQLAALPALSKKELQQLRQLDQRHRDARSRLEAMAAGVKLLRADQPVHLDGRPLQVGEEQRLSAVFQLQVGDGVALQISPGGGEALDQLEGQASAARDTLQQQLAALGATSLEEAEALLEQRSGLEQQQAALQGPAALDLSKLEQQCELWQQRLAQLQTDLQELAPIRQDWEQEQPLPQGLPELQTLQQQLSRTVKPVGAASQTAEQELEAARLGLRQFKEQRVEEASQLEVVRAELADRQQRLAQWIEQHGDHAAQSAHLQSLGRQRAQAEADRNGLIAQRAALGGQDAEQEQQRLQGLIAELDRRIQELIDQRGAAKQRCDSISNQDPFAAVEQARLQLETADADLNQLLRLTKAHGLLRDLFQEAQADLSSRYSEPLAQAIGEYLRPLVPDGPVARLSYDQARGFQGLQLRRGQEYYAFDALSGGMREQLAAALRLSMADVLKDAHDGCLPLVFDDAFTHSDPERIELVKRMLGTAVERGLQVILLTCDPAAYGSWAEQVVELAGS